MTLFWAILLFVLGLILVIKGGDYFVDAASWMAEISGIPKLIIGATVVSIATTLPEMLVSVMAARDSLHAATDKIAQGLVDVSIGNAVGSVTANMGLIMAISLICMPAVINRKDYMLKSLLMLLAAGMIVVCGFVGSINVTLSLVLLVIFAVFFTENILAAKRNMISSKAEARDKSITEKKTVITNIAKFILGAAGIVLGARLLVDNGTLIAQKMGIPERIIGVTMVAIGTSLPELITTLTAISKKQSELSVGNIIGANIMDLTLIMPLSAVISGRSLAITHAAAYVDLPACLLIGLVAVVPTLFTKKFSRFQGTFMLSMYVVYVVLTCTLNIK